MVDSSAPEMARFWLISSKRSHRCTLINTDKAREKMLENKICVYLWFQLGVIMWIALIVKNDLTAVSRKWKKVVT
jgi:hypothetical protein